MNNNEINKQLQKLKAENKHLNDLLDNALKEKEQLELYIDEIEEICECCSELTLCFDCKYYNYYKNELQDCILQKKIKEVKGE